MRGILLLLVILQGCSSADAELTALKGARSIVAEWAAVARLEAAGRVSATYARGMAGDARSQLSAERATIRNPDDPAARVIDSLGNAPDAAQLTAAADALGRLEAARARR